jgi:hypothetical protein
VLHLVVGLRARSKTIQPGNKAQKYTEIDGQGDTGGQERAVPDDRVLAPCTQDKTKEEQRRVGHPTRQEAWSPDEIAGRDTMKDETRRPDD